jgi:hypothetical protein
MAALHSSAALAVNIFDYWTNRSLEPVAEALDLGETPAAIAFEARFSTGLRGTPPTLDVAFRCPNGKVIGIESKFTEWLAPKAHGGNNFTASYFPKNRGLWTLAGLDGAQSLASALRVGHEQFRHLDAAQLLKHMLGLATQHREAAALYYIFYDWPAGPESALHREEIRRFSLHIGNELSFRWATYQDVFSCLAPAVRSTQSQYVQYVQQRYFRDAV